MGKFTQFHLFKLVHLLKFTHIKQTPQQSFSLGSCFKQNFSFSNKKIHIFHRISRKTFHQILKFFPPHKKNISILLNVNIYIKKRESTFLLFFLQHFLLVSPHETLFVALKISAYEIFYETHRFSHFFVPFHSTAN